MYISLFYLIVFVGLGFVLGLVSSTKIGITAIATAVIATFTWNFAYGILSGVEVLIGGYIAFLYTGADK